MAVGSWIYQLDAALITAALTLAMFGAAWVGVRMGRRRPEPTADSGAAATGIFGLLGLLLAFAFGMSGARYESQRELIVREADAIATAALRTDMYLEPSRTALRNDITRYLDARIADSHASFTDRSRPSYERARARAQQSIWQRATQLSRARDNLAASQQMIPALNAMFDLSAERVAAERGHVPELIIALLFLACLIGAFFAAYLAERAAHFDWIAMTGFILLISAVVFVVLDLERPRRGVIDLRVTLQSMVEVRPLLQ